MNQPLEADLVKRLQEDPVWTVREIFGGDPWRVQEEVIRAAFTYPAVLVPSCHSAGKSWLAARTILSFLYAFPNSLVISSAPVWKQVENIIWREIALAWRGAKYPIGGKLSNARLEIEAGTWYAFGFKSEDTRPEQMQGFHSEHLLIVIDEGSGFPDALFEALEANVSGGNSHLLVIGNPTRTNGFFYDGCTKYRGRYHVIKITAFDTPNFTSNGIGNLDDLMAMDEEEAKALPLVKPTLITPWWVWDKVKKYGADSGYVKTRILAEFDDTESRSIIPLSWAETAARRSAENPPTDNDLPIELGVDVARYGGDETVIAVRHGSKHTRTERFRGQDLMQTVNTVVAITNEERASAIKVDGVGVGGGVVDRLSELGLPVVDVNVGQAASDPEQFPNLRAELWWMFRNRLDPNAKPEDQVSIMQDDELLSQLSAPQYSFDSRGRVVVERKEDMARRGIKSPDIADAVILAFAPGTAGALHVNHSDRLAEPPRTSGLRSKRF